MEKLSFPSGEIKKFTQKKYFIVFIRLLATNIFFDKKLFVFTKFSKSKRVLVLFLLNLVNNLKV